MLMWVNALVSNIVQGVWTTDLDMVERDREYIQVYLVRTALLISFLH
jgi:hypothetical protein